MHGRPHPESKRARAIAALLLGAGVMEVARELNLPESSIRNWKRTLTPEQIAEVNAKKGQRLDDLVFDYLQENLTTLRAQSKLLRDAAYVAQQPASEMATLHGVMADKTIRLLEAVAGAPLPGKQIEAEAQS
jgi:Homeodomain-like domain-containing protein